MDDSSDNDIDRRFINQVQEASHYRDDMQQEIYPDESLSNEMIEVEQVDVDVEQLYREQNNNQREGSQQSRYLSMVEFKELFNYEENDRSRKDLKRNFRTIHRLQDGKVKFKSLVGKKHVPLISLDFYLTSSAQFARCIKQIDACSILQSIEANYDNSLGAERFNESILRVLCLN